jgi:biotin carboxylase
MNSGKRESVLLIGLDRYVMEACVRMGIDAVVACGPRGWDSGLTLVPRELTTVRVDDDCNPEAILAALYRAGLGDLRFDGVQTSVEFAVTTAALLADHFGCPGVPPSTMLRFRDKSLQKRRLREAGVPTSRCTVIDDIYDVSAVEPPGWPAVLKPIAGAATERTSAVRNVDELAARSKEYRRQGLTQRTFLLEEYVTGEEWFIDGVRFDGETLFCAVGAYSDSCLTTVEQGRALWLRHFDPDHESFAYDKALPVATAALAGLGLRNGVFHMEVFHNPETGVVTFSECAARRGGGLIQEQLQAKFNFNIGESALLCALGRRPELQLKHRPDAIGSGFLIGPTGLMIDVPSATALLGHPGVELARIERPRGERFSDELEHTVQRIGQVLVAANSAAQLAERIETVQSWFAERVVVVPERPLVRELRSWQRQHWPDAADEARCG